LLIYLEQEMQQRIIPLFHYALKPNGYLFLGTSETLGSFGKLFEPVDRKQKLFRAVPGDGGFRVTLGVTANSRLDKIVRGGEPLPSEKISMRALVERVLLDSYAPASVIIDEQFTALYFHRQTGKYLEPVSGEASLNLLSMAREGLRLPLTIAVRKVLATHQEVKVENVHVRINDSVQTINLIVKPIENAGAPSGLMIVLFEEVAPLVDRPTDASSEGVDERDRRLLELEQELRSTKEYLQTTGEEWQASNEELKSVNEELQSANEELQSTMEEMETAKEELQSVNEELATVNTELESKIDELTQSNSDLDNLLSNVKVGIIFLDRKLHIQRYTPSAVELVNLIPGDIGRPFEHVVSNIVGDLMMDRVRAVLSSLRYFEDEVQTRSGKWYWMGVGPYRVNDNAVEGVVITFTEVTEQKRAQEDLNTLAERMALQPGSGFAFQHLTGLLSALTRWYRFLNSAASERAVYQELCRVVLASGNYKFVWLGRRSQNRRVQPVGYAGQDDGYVALVEQAEADGEAAEGPDVRALNSGEPAVSDDIANDDLFGPLREEAVRRGLRSTLALPIKDRNNRVFGALNIYSTQPNGFNPAEIEWLTVLTDSLIDSFRSVIPDEPE
jgi:two-component system CheB/CheR fusion protein